MHELSIAQSLVELAAEHAASRGATRIQRIQVRLGALSGMLRALYFCFEAVSRGTPCEGAILEIEEVPLTVYCPRCDENKSPGGRYNFACPTCSTPTPEIVTGREMQLVAIELHPTNAVESRSAYGESNHQRPAGCVPPQVPDQRGPDRLNHIQTQQQRINTADL